MICIYIQTINSGKTQNIPYRLTLMDEENNHIRSFIFMPEIVISKKILEKHNLESSVFSNAKTFVDIADELVEIFEHNQLLFTESHQFTLLKSQFISIGYNFNLRPKYLFYGVSKDKTNAIETFLESTVKDSIYGLSYAEHVVKLMHSFSNNYAESLKPIASLNPLSTDFELSTYKMSAGVYYFLDTDKQVIYVGKAKNIRKRLQSHFSKQTKNSHIDYARVKSITVEYSGNDLIAQLIESANIKALKPVYNRQQVKDPAPYIINKGKTAKGISKLQITRKDIKDNMPEKYFNRSSVKSALESFCTDYKLCPKHCGIEKVKGPCSNFTIHQIDCVCSGGESIEQYNKRFEIAYTNFKSKKTHKIFKLKGKNTDEDAFIYMVNDIYEGYGFIDKDTPISGVNDILGHLTMQANNYDTSRIVSNLESSIPTDAILEL